MDIAPELLEQILAHAREEAPNECCGVVAVVAPRDGEPARAVSVHCAVNKAASPLRFEIDGLEVHRLLDSIESDGFELGSIYHSHTRTAPYPSQTDINFAVNWPGVEWIIVGLADPQNPEIRSYLIEGGSVREVEIGQIAV
jgi:proteasome lid subunit RPN8/RPN11